MKKLFLLLALAPLLAVGQSVPVGAPIAIFNTGNNIPGTGPYSPSTFTSNQVLWGNGSGAILSAAPGGSIIADNGSGGLTATASGTNQSITFTPSGSGYVGVSAIGLKTSGYLGLNLYGANGGGITFSDTTATGVHAGIYTSNVGTVMRFYNSVTNGSDASTGIGLVLSGTHTLLGGLTTDGTGVLQFPAGAADNTSGVGFSTDTWLYRAGAGNVVLRHSGTNPAFTFNENGTAKGALQTSAGNMTLDAVSGTMTFQTDSAQAMIFKYNSTEVGRLASTSVWQITSTNTLKFGATAAATIGVSADTTAGVLTFTAPSSGSFSFDRNVAITAGNLTLGSGNLVQWNGRSVIQSTADGTVQISDSTQAASATLQAPSGVNITIQSVGGADVILNAASGRSSFFKNSGTTIFTIGSASATSAKPFITTPTALTYASPTSVDVTLASCFTVTTVNATGSVTFNATAGGTAGQEMTILITNDATSAKTITFGTNFVSTGTLTASAASRHTSITFKSDGTNWIETGRAVNST